MNRKDYDDEKLIDLIARGQLSYRRIGQKLGICRTQVAAIANGKARPELHQHIEAARRKYGTPDDAADQRQARRKDYDDDLLVDLIARGRLNDTDIGRRVGISPSMVSMINRGAARPDLQPKLNAARRKYLHEARIEGLLIMKDNLPTDIELVSPSRQSSCKYDDNEMVELIATSGLSNRQIAEKLSCDYQTVWRIATGRGRKDLQPRIQKAIAAHRAAAHRTAARYLDTMLGLQIKHAVEGTGEFARKCRQYVIDKAWEPGYLDKALAADDLGPKTDCELCRHRKFADSFWELPLELVGQVSEVLMDRWRRDQEASADSSAAEPDEISPAEASLGDIIRGRARCP